MRQRKCKLNHKQSNSVIAWYIKGWSAQDLAIKYNVSHATILNILKRQNIERRTSYETLKLPCQVDYFQIIDSEIKAYWLGFIMADGCIHKNALKIRLSIKDIDHLRLLKTSLKSEHKIGIGIVNGHKFCQLQIKSSQLVSDLQNLGISERKMGKEIFPNLSYDLKKHFLRGLIDGDGWITHKKAYRNPDRLDWTVGIVSASLPMLTEIKRYINDILFEEFGYIETRKFIKTPHYSLCFSGNCKTLQILDWLYEDATIYLDRKHKQYMKLKTQQSKPKKKNQYG